MPFYEYQCGQCGFETEVLQKISDRTLRKCPSCGKSALKRLVSAPVFRLKGAGWYETDFKSDKENKRNIAGDAPAEKSEAPAADAASKDKPGEAAKTDSKPAEKTAEKKPAEVESKPAAAKSTAERTTVKRATAKTAPKKRKGSGRR